MNYKLMQRPMFRLGGNVRRNFQNGTDYSDIEKLITETSEARNKALAAQRSVLPFQVLGGQMENIRGIRNLGDVANILSNVGQSPELFGALGKLPTLDLKMKEGKLKDKITLAALKSKAAGSSTRMKSEKQIRAITTEIQKLRANKELLKGQKGPEVENKLKKINDDLEIAENALKAYYKDDLRDRAVDKLMSNAPFGAMPSEEQIENMMRILKGNAMGGLPMDRRNFQEGSPDPTLPMRKPQEAVDDRKIDTLMKAAPALENPGEVKEMAMKNEDVFAALRRRLPQEITDDVVRLIAYNAEAFADFADISDQSDVDSFNEKYNVQLVLPVENVT